MPHIDERPDLDEFETEWEPPRERRQMPRFMSDSLEWMVGVVLRVGFLIALVVVLFVLGLHACGAGARAVQDEWDKVTETTAP